MKSQVRFSDDLAIPIMMTNDRQPAAYDFLFVFNSNSRRYGEIDR